MPEILRGAVRYDPPTANFSSALALVGIIAIWG